MKEELEQRTVTIDSKGVARNKLGRVLDKELAIIVYYAGGDIDLVAHEKARDEYVTESLNQYRKNYKEPSASELAEMTAAFGKGTKVVDVITGKTIQL